MNSSCILISRHDHVLSFISSYFQSNLPSSVHIVPWIINCLEQISSWEPDTWSAAQELTEFYTAHKILTVFKRSICSFRSPAKFAQFTPPPPLYFFKIRFNVVLQSYIYTASDVNYWDTNYEFLLTSHFETQKLNNTNLIILPIFCKGIKCYLLPQGRSIEYVSLKAGCWEDLC